MSLKKRFPGIKSLATIVLISAKLKINLRAVSYTHLDVYKRQCLKIVNGEIL